MEGLDEPGSRLALPGAEARGGARGGKRQGLRRLVDEPGCGVAVREYGGVHDQEHLGAAEEGVGPEVLEDGRERGGAAVDLDVVLAEAVAGGQGLGGADAGRLGEHEVAVDEADLRSVAPQAGEEALGGCGHLSGYEKRGPPSRTVPSKVRFSRLPRRPRPRASRARPAPGNRCRSA